MGTGSVAFAIPARRPTGVGERGIPPHSLITKSGDPVPRSQWSIWLALLPDPRIVNILDQGNAKVDFVAEAHYSIEPAAVKSGIAHEQELVPDARWGRIDAAEQVAELFEQRRRIEASEITDCEVRPECPVDAVDVGFVEAHKRDVVVPFELIDCGRDAVILAPEVAGPEREEEKRRFTFSLRLRAGGRTEHIAPAKA